MSECYLCEGSGFIGPKNPPNTPMELMQIGCCICSSCNGTGEVQLFVSEELDATLQQALRSSATNISKGRKKDK